MPRSAKAHVATAAAVFLIASAAPSLARQGRGYGSYAPPPPMRAQPPSVSYAGDCGPNPPPGYRHDLKDWRSGFASRDFSCYMLDAPN